MASDESMNASSSPSLQEQLLNWDLDLLALKLDHPLRTVVLELFREHGLCEAVGVPESVVELFSDRLEAMYPPENPYHCAAHAADVLLSSAFLLKRISEVSKRCGFAVHHRLALFLAAAGHDAGHFTLNTSFLRNSKHELVKRYSESPLENFHLEQLLELMQDKECGVLAMASKLTEQERAAVVEIVKVLVLATDMGKHMEHVESFSEWAERQRKSGEGERWDEFGRRLMLCMILKCADLSNLVKPLKVAEDWGERIMEEFYHQGSLEVEMGLPVTTFTDRNHHERRFAKHQHGFLENVVLPLFVRLMEFTDVGTREEILQHASQNARSWVHSVGPGTASTLADLSIKKTARRTCRMSLLADGTEELNAQTLLTRRCAAYVPRLLLESISRSDSLARDVPSKLEFIAAVLIADISGFTQLTERAISENGEEGIEELSTVISNYFSEAIDLVAASGGDVLHFAGDSIICTFALGEDEKQSDCALRAAECGFNLVSNLSAWTPETGGMVTDMETTLLGPTSIFPPLEAAIDSRGSHDSPRVTRQSMLVVDDILLHRLILGKMLSKIGCDVTYAANGEEALEVASKRAFDVIWLDLMMPKIDGHQTASKIRSTCEASSGAHIQAVTSFSDRDVHDQCFASGMDGVTVKPISMNTVVTILQTVGYKAAMKKAVPSKRSYLSRADYSLPLPGEPDSPVNGKSKGEFRSRSMSYAPGVKREDSRRVQPTSSRRRSSAGKLGRYMAVTKFTDSLNAGARSAQGETNLTAQLARRMSLRPAEDVKTDREPLAGGRRFSLIGGVARRLSVATLASLQSLVSSNSKEGSRENEEAEQVDEQVASRRGSLSGFSLSSGFSSTPNSRRSSLDAADTEYGSTSLSMKVMVGFGKCVAVHAGGGHEAGSVLPRSEILCVDVPDSQSRGPFEQIEQLNSVAIAGDVVLSAEIFRLLGSNPAEGEPLLEKQDCVRLNKLARAAPPPPAGPPLEQLFSPANVDKTMSVIRTLIPLPVRPALEAGNSSLLSELRHVTIAFFTFPTLTTDTGEINKLLFDIQKYTQTVQSSVNRFQGSLAQLRRDETGFKTICAFGLPGCTHANNAARALALALDVVRRVHNMGDEVQVGVTTGRLFCSTMGSKRRCEYSFFGDSINLAARLSALSTDEVYCDTATQCAAIDEADFEMLSPIKLKGKAGQAEVLRVQELLVSEETIIQGVVKHHSDNDLQSGVQKQKSSPKKIGRSATFSMKSPDPNAKLPLQMSSGLLPGSLFVGQSSELLKAEECMKVALRENRPHVLFLEGASGVGKSRFARESFCSPCARMMHVTRIRGEQSTDTQILAPWREVFRHLLQFADDQSIPERKRTVEKLLSSNTQAEAGIGRYTSLLLDLLQLMPSLSATSTPGNGHPEATRGKVIRRRSTETVEKNAGEKAWSSDQQGERHSIERRRSLEARQTMDSNSTVESSLKESDDQKPDLAPGDGQHASDVFATECATPKQPVGSFSQMTRSPDSAELKNTLSTLLVHRTHSDETGLASLSVDLSKNEPKARQNRRRRFSLDRRGSGAALRRRRSSLSGVLAEAKSMHKITKVMAILLEQLLLQRGQPYLILVEDAQHFDTHSWTLLNAVLETCRHTVVMVVCLRPFEADARKPDGFTAAQGSGVSMTLHLDALPEEHTRQLLDHRLGLELGKPVSNLPPELYNAVYRTTCGHPLFVEMVAEEIVLNKCVVLNFEGTAQLERQVFESMSLSSLSIEALISARVDRLGPTVALVLKLASVVGNRFHATLLFDLLSAEELSHGITHTPASTAQALEQLIKSEFIVELQAGIAEDDEEDENKERLYNFVNGVTRNVVYGLLPVRQRRSAHKAVGTFHMVAATRMLQADAGAAYEEAARHYTTACKGVESSDPDTVDQALVCWETAAQIHLSVRSLFQEGIAAFENATSLARAAGGEISTTRLALWDRLCAQAHLALGNTEEAMRRMEEGLKALECPITLQSLSQADVPRMLQRLRSTISPQLAVTRWACCAAAEPALEDLGRKRPGLTPSTETRVDELLRMLNLVATYGLVNGLLPLAIKACLTQFQTLKRHGGTPAARALALAAAAGVLDAGPLREKCDTAATAVLDEVQDDPPPLSDLDDPAGAPEGIPNALLLLGFAALARGDVVKAQGRAAMAATMYETAQDERGTDSCRVLGATCSFYRGLGHSVLPAVENLLETHVGHVELGTWGVALTIAIRNALRHHDAALRSLRLAERMLEDEAGAVGPTGVIARAFAVETLWSSGEKEEAVEMVLGVANELLALPAFPPLLPAAMSVVAEMIVRAALSGELAPAQAEVYLDKIQGRLNGGMTRLALAQDCAIWLQSFRRAATSAADEDDSRNITWGTKSTVASMGV